jgi:hypothetical protein
LRYGIFLFASRWLKKGNFLSSLLLCPRYLPPPLLHSQTSDHQRPISAPLLSLSLSSSLPHWSK